MKQLSDTSARARDYRIDATTEEWLAYCRGYMDANDDRDDAAAVLAKPPLPVIFEGQESLDIS